MTKNIRKVFQYGSFASISQFDVKVGASLKYFPKSGLALS